MSNPTLEDLMGLNDPDYLSQDLLSQDFSFFYSGKIIYDLNIKHYLGTNFLDSINITKRVIDNILNEVTRPKIQFIFVEDIR